MFHNYFDKLFLLNEKNFFDNFAMEVLNMGRDIVNVFLQLWRRMRRNLNKMLCYSKEYCQSGCQIIKVVGRRGLIVLVGLTKGGYGCSVPSNRGYMKYFLATELP